MSEYQEMLDLQKQVGFNVASMSNALGVVATKVQEHDNRIATSENEINNLNKRIDDVNTRLNDSIKIDEEQMQTLTESINNRTRDLLAPRDRFDLFGRFTRQCWHESKKHSKVRGRGGSQTKKVYYNDCLNFIGNWEPMTFGGTDGYINHLDLIQSEKKNDSARHL